MDGRLLTVMRRDEENDFLGKKKKNKKGKKKAEIKHSIKHSIGKLIASGL
jgi:hypothetical protein